MTSVQVTTESYDALKRLAAARGSSVEALVEAAIAGLLLQNAAGLEDWPGRWRALQSGIQRGLPDGLDGDEVEAAIDEAIDEVRAERRARSS